jgi:hypothetical protein
MARKQVGGEARWRAFNGAWSQSRADGGKRVRAGERLGLLIAVDDDLARTKSTVVVAWAVGTVAT